MTAWLVPTVRATSWTPLLTVGGFLAATSLLASYAGQWPAGLLGIAAGALAAAAVAALHDPAAELLAALPTTARTRLARRLAVTAPVALVAWVAWLAPGQAVVPGLGWPVAPLLALVATGAAVAGPDPRLGGTALGVAVPLLWTAVSLQTPRSTTRLDPASAEVLLAWQHHPYVVITAALAALTWRTR